ncbi:MAG: hypothetical protein NTX50_17110 [Candidatus Sumerlaeota bacterium]|nr:hypothetical protein [Candidatus Sumerlaeota bacterium]
MITIETDAEILPDGNAKIELNLPANLPLGKYHAVVFLEEEAASQDRMIDISPLNLAQLPFSGWPQDCAFRRADIYGDDGR